MLNKILGRIFLYVLSKQELWINLFNNNQDLWTYLLTNAPIKVIDKLEQNPIDDLFVVYQAQLNNDLYICKGSKYALELYNHMNKFNMLINRPMIKILYGKADIVFKYKIPKLMDIVFTFDATDAERREIYKTIADTPFGTNK